MDEKRKDCLIAYVPECDPNLSFSKQRKRRKSYKIMEQLREIGETHGSKRDAHEMPDETRSCKHKKVITNDLHLHVEIISSVIKRAEELQANLNSQFPSFLRPMIRSNVTAGFWLSLPRLFCKLYLPRRDVNITLIDESHKEYYTKYLPERRGLSAGWRGFSLSHKLQEGDALVFHLVGVWKMKVYIVRANHFGAVDAALSLLNLQYAEVVNSETEKLKEEGRKSPLVREMLVGPLSPPQMLDSNPGKYKKSFNSMP